MEGLVVSFNPVALSTQYVLPVLTSRAMSSPIQPYTSRRVGAIAWVTSLFLTTESILSGEAANGFEFRVKVPDQTVEEAEGNIRDHAQDISFEEAETIALSILKQVMEEKDTPTILLYDSDNAVDSIPVFPKLMEVVGLGYSLWFTTRYLLFQKNRVELGLKIEELKQVFVNARRRTRALALLHQHGTKFLEHYHLEN